MSSLVPIERIERSILLIRGHKVILDADLAKLYGVPTKRLKEQVKRNKNRFPSDFMFILTKQEVTNLRSQIATSSSSWGGTRYPPAAFTEHGAIMVASILNTNRAIEVSVYVVRVFVKLREMLATNKELAGKLSKLERKLEGHDQAISNLFEAIRQLLNQPESNHPKIGFHVKEGRARYKVSGRKAATKSKTRRDRRDQCGD